MIRHLTKSLWGWSNGAAIVNAPMSSVSPHAHARAEKLFWKLNLRQKPFSCCEENRLSGDKGMSERPARRRILLRTDGTAPVDLVTVERRGLERG